MGILADVKIKLQPVSVRLCVVCLRAVERAPFMHMLCLRQQKTIVVLLIEKQKVPDMRPLSFMVQTQM